MIQVRCDICKRMCSDDDYSILTFNDRGDSRSGVYEFHVCHARSGGDVGCRGFVLEAINNAEEAAEHALRERESWLFHADGRRKVCL